MKIFPRQGSVEGAQVLPSYGTPSVDVASNYGPRAEVVADPLFLGWH